MEEFGMLHENFYTTISRIIFQIFDRIVNINLCFLYKLKKPIVALLQNIT
jgi:hypothetical protein